LVLKIVRHDRDLPPNAERQIPGGFLVAVGHLAYLVESGGLSEADRAVAARLVLSYAAQELRAVPDVPEDPLNAKVAAYAIRLFHLPKVAAALQPEERKRLIDLLWRYARGEIRVVRGGEGAENDRALRNALATLEMPHLFVELSREDQRNLAALLFDHAMDKVATIDASRRDRNELWFLSSLSRGHVFRCLSSEERRAVALLLLGKTREDIAMPLSGPEFYDTVTIIPRLLFMLSRDHVFTALGAKGRAEAASTFLRCASQQMGVTVVDRDMVRIRTTPAVVGLEALGKKVVFEALDRDAARQTALLMLSYAKGQTRLDPEYPENPVTQIHGIKLGVEALSREYVFRSLPVEAQKEAAFWLLKYARREEAVGSPHFPLEDLTGGVVKRARRALKREFVSASLPDELRQQVASLGNNPRTIA